MSSDRKSPHTVRRAPRPTVPISAPDLDSLVQSSHNAIDEADEPEVEITTDPPEPEPVVHTPASRHVVRRPKPGA